MKLYRNIFIFVALIAVLGCAYYFISNIESGNEDEITEPVSTITLFETDAQNINSLYVKNNDEEYTLTLEGGKWQIDGVGEVTLLSDRVASNIYRASFIEAQAEIADSGELEKYGLVDPQITLSVKTKDGNGITLYAGDKTLDGSCYYVLAKEKERVYTVSVSDIDILAMSYYYLMDSTLYSFNETEIHKISVIKRGNDEMVLENSTSGEGNGAEPVWNMTAPIQAGVEVQYLRESYFPYILTLSHDSFAKEMPENNYGFNNPYAKYSFYTDNGTLTVTVGDEKEGYRYIKTSQDSRVYMIESEDLKFLDIGYFSLAEKLVYVENINDINSVEFKSENKSIKLAHSETENGTVYMINGKEVLEKTYKVAYQAIIGITLDGYVAEGKSGNSLYEIVYDKKDGTKAVVSFVSIDERNCVAKINGSGTLTVKKKHLEEVMDKLEEIYNS